LVEDRTVWQNMYLNHERKHGVAAIAGGRV
jgi:hypothetical protein